MKHSVKLCVIRDKLTDKTTSMMDFNEEWS
jgi:hypothetical protein